MTGPVPGFAGVRCILAGAVILALSCLSMQDAARAAEPLNVFFIAVGSGSYARSKAPGVQSLDGIPGAVESATAVADILHQGGAKFGLTIVSDPTHFVSVDDVYSAFPRLWDEMVKAKTSRLLVVVYIAAHGVTNGFTWDQYVLPGNLAYGGDVERLASNHPLEMTQKTISVTTIVNYLNGWKVPFLLLLDTCYEGEEQNYRWTSVFPDPTAPCPPNNIISFCQTLNRYMGEARKADQQGAAATATFNQMLESYRAANRFANTYPVMFSTEPGKAVPTVADPWDPDPRATAVAPLARRIMLIVPKAPQARRPVSLGTFLRQMASPTLDTVTTPGVIYSPALPGADDVDLVEGGASARGTVETRLGTATAAATCCSGQY